MKENNRIRLLVGKIKIESGKLKVRSAAIEDAKMLSEWWNNGKVMAHAGFPKGIGISEDKVAELIKEDNNLSQRLIIELENKPIGEVNYRTPKEKVAEIGIKVCDSSQQNKGYGTECLKMLMEYIFMSMGYNKIILDTNLKNKRAQYIYKKLGFRKVRTNIDAWKDQLGELQSSVDYEMLKEGYTKLYGNQECYY